MSLANSLLFTRPDCPLRDSMRHLVRLVPNESDNHAVKVEEEQDQVESEFDERFLWKVT